MSETPIIPEHLNELTDVRLVLKQLALALQIAYEKHNLTPSGLQVTFELPLSVDRANHTAYCKVNLTARAQEPPYFATITYKLEEHA